MSVVATGWDIGGAHLKTARVIRRGGRAALVWRQQPFEIWREPARLASTLRRLMEPGDHGARAGGAHAVTLTAELSDVFPGRAAGVRAVLAAVGEALGETPFRVLDTTGSLLPAATARRAPLRVASANWIAPALIAARRVRQGLLVDVGSTTTDIVPFAGGLPRPDGRDDRRRLTTGELVYTGVLRTPPAALAATVPLPDGACRTIPEHFTQMGDVYVILGRLRPRDYTTSTPDGRGRDRIACAARLARLVGAEARDLGAPAIRRLAAHLMERQIDGIAGAIRAVAAASGCGPAPVAVVCGAGRFLAEAAARRAGARPRPIETAVPGFGRDWGRVAPAAALALLEAGAA
jgi:probable H4MPT-linked C1 transfer pathway protein